MMTDKSGRVIGPADSSEVGPAHEWITASCSVPVTKDTALSNLREFFPTLLTVSPQLKLKFVDIKGALHWWLCEDAVELFDDLIHIVDAPKGDDDQPKTFPLDTLPLWRVEIWESESDTGKCHIKLTICHAIADGSSAFVVHSLFVSVALNRVIPQKFIDAGKGPLITSFEKRRFFPDDYLRDRALPKSWDKIIKIDLYPQVDLPSHSVNMRWSADLAPVSAFCAKHGVSIQAIVMTLSERAIREFNKGVIDPALPLVVNVPVNTRNNPDASLEFKKSIFFSGAASVTPVILPQSSILEDILHCRDQFRAALKTHESSETFIAQSEFINRDTLKLVFPSTWPSPMPHNVIFASNLGKVCEGFDDVTFGTCSGVDENGYWLNLYAYNNGKRIYFVLVHPYNITPRLLELFRQSSDDILSFIQTDISS